MNYFILVVYLFFSPHLALSQANDYQLQHQTVNTEYILNLNDKLTEDQTKSISDSNATQIAQVGRCPISMPQIRSAVVFQSVEAPQIEPINQQAYLPYDDYDLVMGKPAGILIDLNRARMDRRREFALAFTIKGERSYRYNCFHVPFNGEMKEGQEDVCSFTRSDLLREGDSKFFPLPMNEAILNQEGKFTVRVAFYPRGYNNNPACLKTQDFNINIIKTHSLKLGFTRVYGGRNCHASRDRNTGYNIASYNTVENFANSIEVLRNIPRMFPLLWVDSRVLKYTWGERQYDYVGGSCNNSPARDRLDKTAGVLSDVAQLEYIRASLEYHKLIAIVPESYFAFHGKRKNKDNESVGFIISPRWKEWRWYWLGWIHWYKSSFVGGSWNIAFIHEGELNLGTVAHELAHTVGQGKEFYKSYEKCRRFRKDSLEDCKDYQIPRALDARIDKGRQSWEFIKNKLSIMGGKRAVKNRKKSIDIHDLWIDRDTFQKTFELLSQKAVVPNTEEFHGESTVKSDYQRDRQSSLKVIIKGFYYEKEKEFCRP